MPRRELTIETDDGTCHAELFTPDAPGPHPGVLYYPDAGGPREAFTAMAERLAAGGYAVLLPDIYYREAPYAPFDPATAFSDPDELARIQAMMGSLTPARIGHDAVAYVDALLAAPEVGGTVVGTAGYCLGGMMVLRAAAADPDRVAAVASFHGGNLAPADDPDSPHLLADRIRGVVLVAAAQDDQFFPDEQQDRLRAAFEAAGVRGTVETWPAAHGFAVPDNPTHDDAADQRHRQAMAELFAQQL